MTVHIAFTASRRHARRAWNRRRGMSGLLLLAAAGCIGEQGVAPSVQSPELTLGSIHASPLNAVLAVGQTVQITVTGTTISGASIAAFDSVRYVLQSVTDTIRVQISPSGLVTARAESGSNPVFLNVFAFKGGLVRADQVVLQTTDDIVPGATLSIQPPDGDSAKLAIGSSKTIAPVIQNVAGDSVAYPAFRYIYHDADASKMGCYSPQYPGLGKFTDLQLSIATCSVRVGLNEIHAQASSGTVWVIADAMVYGVHLRDSVQYTLTNPYSSQVFVYANNLSVGGAGGLISTVSIAPGGVITFDNSFDPSLGTSVDFVFDTPSAATAADPPSASGGSAGNVMGLAGYESSDRRFLTAGTYTYTVTVHGSIPPFTGATVSGQILVQ